MATVASIVTTFPRRERTPESLIWEGVVRWDNDAKMDNGQGTRDSLVLKARGQVWRTKDGRYFLAGYAEKEAFISDNGKAYCRDRKMEGRTISAVNFGNALNDLAVKAVLEWCEADAGRGGDGGYAPDEPNF